jgi:dienelactone hydrolase
MGSHATAAAKKLADEGYTRAERIGFIGRSNGGATASMAGIEAPNSAKAQDGKTGPTKGPFYTHRKHSIGAKALAYW